MQEQNIAKQKHSKSEQSIDMKSIAEQCMDKQSKAGQKRGISLKQLLGWYFALALLIFVTIWNAALGFVFVAFLISYFFVNLLVDQGSPAKQRIEDQGLGELIAWYFLLAVITVAAFSWQIHFLFGILFPILFFATIILFIIHFTIFFVKLKFSFWEIVFFVFFIFLFVLCVLMIPLGAIGV